MNYHDHSPIKYKKNGIIDEDIIVGNLLSWTKQSNSNITPKQLCKKLVSKLILRQINNIADDDNNNSNIRINNSMEKQLKKHLNELNSNNINGALDKNIKIGGYLLLPHQTLLNNTDYENELNKLDQEQQGHIDDTAAVLIQKNIRGNLDRKKYYSVKKNKELQLQQQEEDTRKLKQLQIEELERKKLEQEEAEVKADQEKYTRGSIIREINGTIVELSVNIIIEPILKEQQIIIIDAYEKNINKHSYLELKTYNDIISLLLNDEIEYLLSISDNNINTTDNNIEKLLYTLPKYDILGYEIIKNKNFRYELLQLLLNSNKLQLFLSRKSGIMKLSCSDISSSSKKIINNNTDVPKLKLPKYKPSVW